MSYQRLFVANVDMKRKDHEYKATRQSRNQVPTITAVAKWERLNGNSLISDKAFTELMNIQTMQPIPGPQQMCCGLHVHCINQAPKKSKGLIIAMRSR